MACRPTRPARQHAASARIQYAADRNAPQLRQDFLAAVRALRARASEPMLDQAIHGPQAVLDLLDDLFKVRKAVAAPAAEGYTKTYASVFSDLQGTPAMFPNLNVTNPRVIAWAENQSAQLVTRVTQESKDAIRAAIGQGVRGNLPRPQVRQLIRQSIGLNAQQATALANYATGLMDKENPHPNPDPLIERYGDRLLDQRASTIARTETIRASNSGVQETWKAAADQGLIDPQTFQQEWMVTDDDRLCEECEPLGGQRVGLDESFDGADQPPLHPNCRCTIVSVDELPPEAIDLTQPESSGGTQSTGGANLTPVPTESIDEPHQP